MLYLFGKYLYSHLRADHLDIYHRLITCAYDTCN